MPDDFTPDFTPRDLIADVSRRLAARTDDPDAQGWASDLNQALEGLDPGEDPRPNGLTATDRENFHTLMDAASNDDVVVLHAREKATGHHHALLSIASAVPGSEDTDLIPVARMLDRSATEDYDDPGADMPPTEDAPDRTELLARLPEWVDVPADATDEDLRAMLREVDADDPPLYTDPEG